MALLVRRRPGDIITITTPGGDIQIDVTRINSLQNRDQDCSLKIEAPKHFKISTLDGRKRS